MDAAARHRRFPEALEPAACGTAKVSSHAHEKFADPSGSPSVALSPHQTAPRPQGCGRQKPEVSLSVKEAKKGQDGFSLSPHQTAPRPHGCGRQKPEVSKEKRPGWLFTPTAPNRAPAAGMRPPETGGFQGKKGQDGFFPVKLVPALQPPPPPEEKHQPRRCRQHQENRHDAAVAIGE